MINLNSPQLALKRARTRRPLLSEMFEAITSAVQNRRLIWSFLTAPRASPLGQLVTHRPEIWEMVLTPYVSAHWGPSERLSRILDHCKTIETLGPLFNAPWNGYVVLTSLPEIGPSYRLMIDQPRWLLREGQSAISLWDNGDRLFSLSYSLSSNRRAVVAYVGGIIGLPGMLGRYRELTKSAHGMRPTDLTVELFRMICKSINVERILCVSDQIRQDRSDYYLNRNGEAPILRPLNPIWTERGAVLREDGFFALPTTSLRRASSTIPRNKRTMYRRRYEMLDSISARINEAVQAGLQPQQILYHGDEWDGQHRRRDV
jgi:uncharacterized protein